jgi:hypothetical protein
MVLKGNTLHPDDMQGIRGFVMPYKDMATFAMTYKELSHCCTGTYNLLVYCLKNFKVNGYNINGASRGVTRSGIGWYTGTGVDRAAAHGWQVVVQHRGNIPGCGAA